MRDLTQYAPKESRYCMGSDSLRGALGLVWCQARCISTLSRCNKILPRLKETPARIIKHYATEPPAVNFVEVSTFFHGKVLGLDINSAAPFPKLFSLSRHDLEVCQEHQRGQDFNSIPVYDARALLRKSRDFLSKHPISPGARVFVAKCESEGNPGETVYAMLAIAEPQDLDANYLLMEDAGKLDEKAATSEIAEVQESLALSVLACEEIENNPPLGGHLAFRYKAVYLVWDTATVKAEDRGWAQVQLMYLAPPKDSV